MYVCHRSLLLGLALQQLLLFPVAAALLTSATQGTRGAIRRLLAERHGGFMTYFESKHRH